MDAIDPVVPVRTLCGGTRLSADLLTGWVDAPDCRPSPERRRIPWLTLPLREISLERHLYRGCRDRGGLDGLPVRRPAQAGVVRMTTFDFFQVVLYLAVLLVLVKPVGSYMALAFSETPNRVTRFGGGWSACSIGSLACVPMSRWAGVVMPSPMLVFNMVRHARCLHLCSDAAVAAAESAAIRRGDARFGDRTPPSVSPPTPTGRATAAKAP